MGSASCISDVFGLAMKSAKKRRCQEYSSRRYHTSDFSTTPTRAMDRCISASAGLKAMILWRCPPSTGHTQPPSLPSAPPFPSPPSNISCCNTILYTLALSSVDTRLVFRSSILKPSKMPAVGDCARSARSGDSWGECKHHELMKAS